MNKRLIISALALFVIGGTVSLVSYQKNREVQKKVRALCLHHASVADARRHIAIVEKMPETPLRDEMFPIHIMFRETEKNPWMMVGTGTYLKNYEPPIITAHHLFGGHPGEFGYRRISKKIFTGEEPVLPIVKVIDPLVNDSILCSAGAGKEFPRIAVPERTMWQLKKGDTEINFHKAFGTVRLLTRPQKPLQLLLWTEIEAGRTRYCFFEGGSTPGESGTGGIVDTAGENSLLVVLRNINTISFKTPVPVNGPYGVGMLIRYGK